MYKVGEGGINGQRISRTFANALIGKMALYAGGYQTIRTDMPELYEEVQFEVLRLMQNVSVLTLVVQITKTII